MSTSDPDLEARLAALRPPPPRADLRDDVLDAVRTELAEAAQPSFLDRLLARRSTWAAAAVVLLALVVTTHLASRAQEDRLATFAVPPTQAHRAPTRPHLHAWQERDALIARLLDDGGRDD